MEQFGFRCKFLHNAHAQDGPLRRLLLAHIMHWCRCHILKLTFKAWCWQSWTDEAQNYRASYEYLGTSWTLEPWDTIATLLPVYHGAHVKYCFSGVLQLALTCKTLRILFLRNFRRCLKQMLQALRNPANFERNSKKPFLMVVKLSATLSRVGRRAGSSMDTTEHSILHARYRQHRAQYVEQSDPTHSRPGVEKSARCQHKRCSQSQY